MGIRSLLRTEFGQCIKNKPITHTLDSLSHAAIMVTGENPEETDLGWTKMEQLSSQLADLHSQEMALSMEIADAEKEEAEVLETHELLDELQTTVPPGVLEAKAAPPANPVDAAQWAKWWKDPRSWQPGFSLEDWQKENAAASAGEAAKQQETSSTGQKLPAPKLTGPRPANVAQAVVMWLKRRAVTAQVCQAATDKVSALQAKLRRIQEQQQQASNELIQGWGTVFQKGYSKGSSMPQSAVEVVLSVHPDADQVQQLREALIQSQMQVAAAQEEAAAAKARADAAKAAHAALLQQQEKAPAVAIVLNIQEPSISLSLNVTEPQQQQQQDEGLVQLLQDRLAAAEAELKSLKHQQRPITLQVLVPSDAAAELEGLHARLAVTEAALAATQHPEYLQDTHKGDEQRSQGEVAASAAPAAAAAAMLCAGIVSEAQPATPRVDLGLCGQQLAMVAARASVAASSSAASYESCCDSSSVQGSVCNGGSSELGEALSSERLGAAASAAGDAGGLDVMAVEETASAGSKATKASAADGATQQVTAPVTSPSSKKQQQTGAAAGDGDFDSGSANSKWLEIIVAADYIIDQGHHHQQQQGKPRVSDDLNPDGLQDKNNGSVLAMLRNSVMAGSGGASMDGEATHTTAGGSETSAAVHSSSNGSRAGRYTCMPLSAPPAAAILVGSVGFTAALADKMGLLPAGPAGGSWAGGLWSAVNDASSTAASSVGGWISSTWGGWQ